MRYGLFLNILMVFVLWIVVSLFSIIKMLTLAVLVSANVAVQCLIWFPTISVLDYTYKYMHVLYWGAQTS